MTARNYDHVFLALEAHVTLGGSARCRHRRKNGRLLSSTSHGLAKRFSRLALPRLLQGRLALARLLRQLRALSLLPRATA